jgi:hypothetical protein
LSNVDTTRPITRHQYLFRFVESGVCRQKDIELSERFAGENAEAYHVGIRVCK